uniref:Uncharacterized protein n=1 Tax=Anguilla anguilla TaxID=7936 RepID=A0A0E9WGD5_ANGAN
MKRVCCKGKVTGVYVVERVRRLITSVETGPVAEGYALLLEADCFLIFLNFLNNANFC